MTEGTIFLDCGTDLGSSRLVPGKFALPSPNKNHKEVETQKW